MERMGDILARAANRRANVQRTRHFDGAGTNGSRSLPRPVTNYRPIISLASRRRRHAPLGLASRLAHTSAPRRRRQLATAPVARR